MRKRGYVDVIPFGETGSMIQYFAHQDYWCFFLESNFSPRRVFQCMTEVSCSFTRFITQ